MPEATVCLCMIVKNESKVILDCLRSVKPLIDHWVIVDTGSTDGTQELIQNELQEIAGELHERPWVNFGHNRTEAIRLAEPCARYLLFIDADETLDRPADFSWPDLKSGAYTITKRRGNRSYRLPALVRSDLEWQFKGVLHEYLEAEKPAIHEALDGIVINSDRSGARGRTPETYRRDALVLEAGLLDEPDNARYVFYLAQSYRDCEDFDLAIRYYERRGEMGGWAEEVYNARYQAANCRLARGDAWPDILDAYLRAYASRPTRAEALFAVASQYFGQNYWSLAAVFLEKVSTIPFPANDVLFVEPEIYHYRAELLLAVCLHYLGDFERACQINEKLLQLRELPETARQRILENLRFSRLAMDD